MALALKTQKDVKEFLVTLKKAVSQNQLGVLSYEHGSKNDRHSGTVVYHGVFQGPVRILLEGKGGSSYSFDSSEVDVGFAFAIDNGSGEVICHKTGEHMAQHFEPYNWSSTAETLIRQIQVFSRDCQRKLTKTAAQLTEEKILSLKSLA